MSGAVGMPCCCGWCRIRLVGHSAMCSSRNAGTLKYWKHENFSIRIHYVTLLNELDGGFVMKLLERSVGTEQFSGQLSGIRLCFSALRVHLKISRGKNGVNGRFSMETGQEEASAVAVLFRCGFGAVSGQLLRADGMCRSRTI